MISWGATGASGWPLWSTLVIFNNRLDSSVQYKKRSTMKTTASAACASSAMMAAFRKIWQHSKHVYFVLQRHCFYIQLLVFSMLIITRSWGRCRLTRSLRFVLSLALIDCLYCHFSGTKGHFISTASCRREASSAHSESTASKRKVSQGFPLLPQLRHERKWNTL